MYLQKLCTQIVCPRSPRACSSPVLANALLGSRNDADDSFPSHFAPDLSVNHTEAQGLFRSFVQGSSHLSPSLLCHRAETRRAWEVFFPLFSPYDSAISDAEPLLMQQFQPEIRRACSGNSLDTTLVHREGLSSFSGRYLCQSTDNSFHTWSSKSDRSSSYYHSPLRRPIRPLCTLCLPSATCVQKAVTIIDLHLHLASRIISSWSTRSILFGVSCSIFHRGLCPSLSCSCLCSASSARAFVIMSCGRPSLLVKSFDVFPENRVQLPFHFVTFVLGIVEVALHLFDQVPCFVLLFPSLLKLLQQIPDHSSFFFVLVFRP